MTKNEYLSDIQVVNFINYLNECLTQFRHSYINRRTHANWTCVSIIDAFNKYDWGFSYFDPINNIQIKGSTYLQNENALNSLSNGLRNGYFINDNDELFEYSKAICKWGGVLGGKTSGNLFTLINNSTNLSNHYKNTEILLSGPNADDNLLAGVFNMNAGFTKIYSLLFDNLIIYDSRVGAALCWLVKNYCTSKNIKVIPESLFFSWAKSKEGANAANPKNRNPGPCNNQEFPNFSNNGDLQSKSMLRASWLIEKLVENNQLVAGNTISQKMRTIEAALFMIGYDLPLNFENIPNLDLPTKNSIDILYQFCTSGGENQKKHFNIVATDGGGNY